MNRLTRTIVRTLALLLTTASMWSMPYSASVRYLRSAEAGRTSPVLAFALSLFVPGAIQAYNGEWDRGAFVLGSAVAAVGLFAEDGVNCVVDDDGENCTLAAAGLGLAALS
jgi:hypothetical protein